MYSDVWYLPCNETPFLNRNHPVFLAIKDRIVDCDEGRIRLKHFGWVTPSACCKTQSEAEEELFHQYETMWLDKGKMQVRSRSTLSAYYRHLGQPQTPLPWFDLTNVLYDDNVPIHRPEPVINVEAFMRP